MGSIQIKRDTTFMQNLEHHLQQEGPFSTWEHFQMAFQAGKTTITPSFTGLRALDYLPAMEFMPHQTACAEEVIEEMDGRAILADEVGLGKTIEAGLILKEYMIRGMVKKALILAPASLVNQWVTELNNKFYIPAIAHRKNYAWGEIDIMVTSMDTAKRSPHREEILDIDYDFILIDEAHKLKNHQTKNYQFVRQLKKKYALFLTATPVQNKLLELFNLVSILKPGHLGDIETFRERFGNKKGQQPDDPYLKQLVQQVMVRNTRKETTIRASKRHIETVWIDFTEEEQQFYNQLASIALSTFQRLTLQREMCSSREACFMSIKKMIESNPEKESYTKHADLMNQLEELPQHAKAEKVIEIIQQHQEEKIIIFTEYRATQVFLQWYLQQHHITSVPYRGGFKRGKKDWMRKLFEQKAQVLIATEAGGEGINLQFCHIMINYDLPWNPMRLEQRIGRIHRYGQTSDVHIFNFAIHQTVEEHIMTLLYEKIYLFEQVIGQLDQILSNLHISDVEQEIQSIFQESTSHGEAKIKLNNLSSVIHAEIGNHIKEDDVHDNSIS